MELLAEAEPGSPWLLGLRGLGFRVLGFWGLGF